MPDLSWVSGQAHTLHNFFYSIFYALVTLFLLIGILIEYFKLPLGSTPGFSTLVGRALVAVILLHTFPEVTHLLADFSDGVAKKVGDLNQFHVVLEKMGEQLKNLSFSWVSAWSNFKGYVLLLLSLLTFCLLYFSTYVAQAFLMYTWTLIYVLSPLLIALFVLPQTAAATSGLYRSLIEASCWKILWAIIATLLWSSGVSDLHQANIVTGICFNLILAASLLMTPMVVHQLASSGIAAMAGTLGSIAVPGMGTMSIGRALQSGTLSGQRMYNASHSAVSHSSPTVSKAMNHIPVFNVPPRKTIFKAPEKERKTK